MNVYIAIYQETVEDDRVVCATIKADDARQARLLAADYFEDWNFIEPDVTIRLVPATFAEEITEVVHVVWSFSR